MGPSWPHSTAAPRGVPPVAGFQKRVRSPNITGSDPLLELLPGRGWGMSVRREVACTDCGATYTVGGAEAAEPFRCALCEDRRRRQDATFSVAGDESPDAAPRDRDVAGSWDNRDIPGLVKPVR